MSRRSTDGCDDDFLPTESSSKLSMIFSGGYDHQTSDLKYVAPKQPHPRTPDGIEQQKSSDATNKVLFATPVELYAYKEKTHRSQGRVMCCIIKDQQERNFTLLLYRSKHHPLTQTQIHSSFTIMIQPNNYASFTDDDDCKWSVHIQGDKYKEFLNQVGICRAVSSYHEAPSISPNIVQNLSLGDGASIQEGDTVKLVYCSWNVEGGRKGEIVENEKEMKLRLTKISELWQMGLIGAQVNLHRIIFVPNKMPNVIPLVAHEVIVEKIRKKNAAKSLPQLDLKDKPSISSKPSDSSEPNTPSLTKEALRNRMAKVGQPLLPPKNFQNNLAIDSECELEDLKESSPNISICSSIEEICSNPPYTSSITDKSFQAVMTSSNHHDYQSGNQSPFSTVPYNPPTQHGPIVAYHSVPYPPLHPPASNNTDPVMTLLLSESRSQNTELRIALSKVSDKVEEIHSKVKTIDDKPPTSPRVMESLSTHKLNPQDLLRDITALVNENETLKSDLKVKENQYDTLNTRNSDLIQKNHKLLEEKTELLDRLNHLSDNTKKELKDFLKIKEEKVKLMHEIEQLTKENKSLQADIVTKDTQIDWREKNVERLQEENDSSHLVNKTLESKILQLKSEHQKKNKTEKENLDELDKLRAEKQLSDDTKKAFEADITLLTLRHEQELQEERMRGEANLNINESIELREKLNKLNRETDNLTNELHEIKLAKTDLEKQLFEAKGQLDVNTKKLNLKINLLSEEKSCVLAELEAFKVKHFATEQELQELKKCIANEQVPPRADTSQFVKQIMNAVYKEAKKTFDSNQSYSGKDVVQVLLAVIRDTTLVHLDQPSRSPVPDRCRDTPRGTPTSRSGSTTPQTPIRHVSSNPFITDHRGSSCFDELLKPEDTTNQKNDQEVHSDAGSEAWHETPPPPPPLFSDSEDDNWLS